MQSGLFNWFMLYGAVLELFESNEVCVKYEFILGLKELLLLNSISQTITKKEKANNKQKNRKNQNQAILRLT